MFRKKKDTRKHILLLEDDTQLAKAVRVGLEGEGYIVAVVQNGEQAIHVFDGGHFDLALLDIITPFRNGFEVLKHIRKKNKEIPIFIISNLSHSEDKRDALTLGADKYFVKSESTLEEILKHVHDGLA